MKFTDPGTLALVGLVVKFAWDFLSHKNAARKLELAERDEERKDHQEINELREAVRRLHQEVLDLREDIARYRSCPKPDCPMKEEGHEA
jgi:uncharacterized protein YlxW (UPF0749 family)